jgi:ribosomal 30S subunit maturation factor RimM
VLVGTISDVVGANAELLEITKIDSTGEEPVLVPFVQSLVPTVDLKAGRVEVVDLPGLLDPE